MKPESNHMAKRPTNRIKFKLWQTTITSEYDGPAADGVFYAACSLLGRERLELIEKLQAKHAELEAVGR
jgi:hypothetical protein